MRVLIVDDEPGIRKTTRIAIETGGHSAAEAPNGLRALKALDEENFDAVFLDLKLGADDGLEVLAKLLKAQPTLAVVMFTAYANIATAVEAMRRGAFDFIPKPFTPDQIRAVLAKIEKARALETRVRSLESDLAQQSPLIDLESTEPGTQRALEMAFKAADTPASILILGPSGTGKSVLARELHRRSARRDALFVTVSCPSLSRELLEADLFGHVRGSFTGAIADSFGKVAAAEGGTLFLDEIGELAPEIQPKLLRLLQEREYERVGENRPRRANVRVIAATNRNLAGEVKAGRFREDLFYRLNVISVVLPGLNERPGDLARFIENYRKFFAANMGKKVRAFSPAALNALSAYRWPGNLRELRNVIERATILATGETIELCDLPEEFGAPANPAVAVGARVTLDALEAEHLRRILALSHNLDDAARTLGIDPATLYRKRQKLALLSPRMLRTRLTLGLLPLLLLFLLVCLYAIRTSQVLGDSIEGILARNFHSIRVVQELHEAAAQMDAALGDARQGDVAAALPRFTEGRARFKRGLNDELLAQPSARKAELLNTLDAQFLTFTSGSDETLRMGTLNGLALRKRNEADFFTVNHTLDALRELDNQEIIEAEIRVKTRIDDNFHLLVAAMVIVVVLFFYLAWRLADAFLKPIQALTTSAVALGDGELEREVPVTSADEIGQLARAFNTMAAHLRAYREATLAKVLRTQRTMEATLTSTPEPVFVVGRDGTHEVRNPAADELAHSAAFAQGFPPGLAEPLDAVLHSGAHYLPTDYSKVVTLRTGREDRHYLPRILAIGDKLTEFTGAAVILQDVTKFRLLDDAKTNLVGTVSHELKSPLTSLRMAVYLLLEQKIAGLSATQQELLETVRDEADRLLRILDSLLDLARLESGTSSLDRGEVQIPILLSEIATEARGFIESAGLKLEVTIEPELAGVRITVDSSRLRHVFINLLTNAAKYSPPGGTVTLSAAVAPLDFVRFAVADQGPGIPAESLPHVFERFYRAPGQTKTGAGLGLAIAREIVVAHGGSIAGASEPGRGTVFYFLLPR